MGGACDVGVVAYAVVVGVAAVVAVGAAVVVVGVSAVVVGASVQLEEELLDQLARAPLVDPIGDRAGARLRVAPMAPDAEVRAAYRLPTRHRGEIAVGPLEVEAGVGGNWDEAH